MGLDLRKHLDNFPEICKRKFGRTYNFSALEKRFLQLRDGKRRLAAKDVSHIFHPDSTPFGRYWPQPNEKELDKVLCANHLALGSVPPDAPDLLRRLLSIFRNVGVSSIILRFVHPDRFGVFSTPVLHLV